MNYDDLVKNQQLQREANIKFDQVTRLLEQSKKDLKDAKEAIKISQTLALDSVYKSMFHAANALVRSQGYRPGKTRQHIGVLIAIERTLGKKSENILHSFDNLRRQRNDFEYQAVFSSSRAQIKDYFRVAEEFISIIEKYISDKNPQKRLLK